MSTKSSSSRKQSMVSITDFLGNIVPPFLSIEGWIQRTIYFPPYNYIFFVFQIFILEYRSRIVKKVCNVFIVIRCIDVNKHIQLVLDLRLQDQIAPQWVLEFWQNSAIKPFFEKYGNSARIGTSVWHNHSTSPFIFPLPFRVFLWMSLLQKRLGRPFVFDTT